MAMNDAKRVHSLFVKEMNVAIGSEYMYLNPTDTICSKSLFRSMEKAYLDEFSIYERKGGHVAVNIPFYISHVASSIETALLTNAKASLEEVKTIIIDNLQLLRKEAIPRKDLAFSIKTGKLKGGKKTGNVYDNLLYDTLPEVADTRSRDDKDKLTKLMERLMQRGEKTIPRRLLYIYVDKGDIDLLDSTSTVAYDKYVEIAKPIWTKWFSLFWKDVEWINAFQI